jgi:hypothetical protein
MTPESWHNRLAARGNPLRNPLSFQSLFVGSTKSEQSMRLKQNASRPALVEQIADRHTAEGKAMPFAKGPQAACGLGDGRVWRLSLVSLDSLQQDLFSEGLQGQPTGLCFHRRHNFVGDMHGEVQGAYVLSLPPFGSESDR